jgi:hypothetical protein
MDSMATSSIATSLSLPEATRVGNVSRNRTRRRRISPEAGRALEILGHAIEYLADEYAHRAASISSDDGKLDAVKILMSMNRQIYLACPEAPGLVDRWRSLLRPRAA